MSTFKNQKKKQKKGSANKVTLETAAKPTPKPAAKPII